MDDPVSGALEVLVPKGIEPSTSGVHAAVDFDDEAQGRADEVRDVAADDDLAAEGDAEAAAAQLGPEQLLGERWVLPQTARLRASSWRRWAD